MIWRSAICFRAVAMLGTLIISESMRGGPVTGQVRLVRSHDAAVNRKSDFEGVVVWLTPTEPSAPRLVRKHVVMLQKNKTFTPHILAVQTGTSVDFPNLDPIFHNAFSNFDGEIFDIGLYAPGSSRSVRFTRPGIVKVFCNIHPSMAANIVVVDSSFFAITDKAGRYTIPNVPPGTYRVHFFHERATSKMLANLVQTITVDKGANEVASADISESGYLPVEHKNKYGREYPVNRGTADTYSLSIQ